MRNIDHRQAEILTHLRSGKPHTICRDHRVQHVSDKLDKRIIHFIDGAAALAEDRVAVLDYFADHG
jgi:GH43 family beta-xylosidase